MDKKSDNPVILHLNSSINGTIKILENQSQNCVIFEECKNLITVGYDDPNIEDSLLDIDESISDK